MSLSKEDLFEAYYRARKGKSKKKDIILREESLEENMNQLYNDIVSGKYMIGQTHRYIIHDPVCREIIVIPFRDRIVQHLIYAYLLPIFEPQRIYDSYANRVGKGTLFGIKRVDKMMRSCSQQYTRDCWVLKCDIQSCFMSIDRRIVWKLITQRLFTVSVVRDKKLILKLIHASLFHDYISGRRDFTSTYQRKQLPYHKSILSCDQYHGLPLGNLTSHLFANILLHQLDLFVKHKLRISHYGRYVDDFVLFHSNKKYLCDCISYIRAHLQKIGLKLHPNKIYLQHYSKGLRFCGVMILPYRRYINHRTLKNRKKCLNLLSYQDHKYTRSMMYSYVGLVQHHNTYNLQSSMWNRLRATMA